MRTIYGMYETRIVRVKSLIVNSSLHDDDKVSQKSKNIKFSTFYFFRHYVITGPEKSPYEGKIGYEVCKSLTGNVLGVMVVSP